MGTGTPYSFGCCTYQPSNYRVIAGRKNRPSKGVAMSDPEFLRIREAAEVMQVGRDTTYNLVREGKIPSVRIGNQIRIPRRALIEHLEREAEGQVAEGVS
jgi:excisionase family DNA binding protein